MRSVIDGSNYFVYSCVLSAEPSIAAMRDPIKRRLRICEEILNAASHGIGVLLALAGCVFLLLTATPSQAIWFAVYGVTLVGLYAASTLYHSLMFTRLRNLLRKVDHMAIFLLIAGTYTPFCVITLNGWMGWAILGAVWTLAIGGIVFKVFFTGKMEWLSLTLYILMGWIGMLAIIPIYKALPISGFVLLLSGGLAYTIGTWFYARSAKPFQHVIWHLFVLAGSILHFLSIATLVEPA